VSKDFETRGFTGVVVSQRILDEIGRINQISSTTKPRAQFGGGQSDVLANIQVPQTSLNVQAIVTILRDLFGQSETRIGGELTGGESGQAISMVVRTEHKAVRHAAPFAGPDLDALIKDAAIEVLKRIDPYVLASYFFQKQQFKEMDEMIDDILAKPDVSVRAWALNLRGINLARQNRYDEAIAYYDRAIQLDRRLGIALLNKGNIVASRGDHEAAITLFRKAHTAQPNDYLPLNNWGALLADLGEYDEALVKLQQAVQLDPKQALPYILLGGLWERMRDLERAAIAFEKAHEMSLDDLDALTRLGTIFYRLGHRALADARFNTALSRLLHVDVYNSWGDALLDAGDVDAARQRYRKSLDAGPWDPFAHLRIGHTWLMEDKLDLAEASCRNAMAIDETSSAVHRFCGDVFRTHGDEKSVEHYKQALALAPDDVGTMVTLAEHYYAIGNADKGFETFQSAVKVSPSDSAIYHAWAYWRLSDQDYNGALEMYDRSISLYPANENAYEGRALVLQCLGRMQHAEKSQSKADAIHNRKVALLGQDTSAMSMIERYSRLGTLIPP
jgi:tetratricopeptide (TPR) repeat protein